MPTCPRNPTPRDHTLTGGRQFSSDLLPRVAGLAAWIVGLLLSVRYAVVTWQNRIAVDAVMPYDPIGLSDFRDAVWLPLRYYRQGGDPYDWRAFIEAHPGTQGFSPYSPHHFVLAAPFTYNSWAADSLGWLILLCLCLLAFGAISGWLAARMMGGSSPWLGALQLSGAGSVLVWVARPTTSALGLGQPSIPYGCALALALVLLATHPGRRSVPVTLACVVGLTLGAVKAPLLVIAALVLLGLWAWREIVWTSLVVLLLSVPVLLHLSAGTGLVEWLRALPGHVAGGASRFDPRYVTENAWIDVGSLAHRFGFGNGVQFAAMAGVLALSLAVAIRFRHQPPLAVLTATVGGLLAVPHGGYDLLVLYPVLVVATIQAWRDRGHRPTDVLTGAALLSLAVSALIPNRDFGLGPGFEGPAPLQTTAVLLAFILFVALALAPRPPRPDSPSQT